VAVTIVATPGASDANAFASEDAMALYCEARLGGEAWTGSDAQLAALVEATRDLNTLPWIGRRATATQALAWPRIDVPDSDAPTPNAFVSETTIPAAVRDATCELALQYVLAPSAVGIADPQTGVIRKKVGPLETEWSDRPGARRTGLGKYTRVLQLLAPYLGGSGLTLVRT
jgi:hypothetical protein